MSATEIVLFESSDGAVTLPVEVDPTGSDVWLTQAQMAMLFDTTKQNVSLHLGNCFKEGELDKFSVVKESLTTASDGKRYRTKSYALDAIISVGYRVKSKRGVEFRRWATRVLRRYIVEGHAENERRLRELGQAVSILARLPEGDVNTHQVLDIVRSYAPALDLLDDYDHQSVSRPEGKRDAYVITYDECREVISNMRFGNESDLFGVEKDDSFRASIGDIYAGFAGQDAYPSVTLRAHVAVVRGSSPTSTGILVTLQMVSVQPPCAAVKRYVGLHSHQRLFHSRAFPSRPVPRRGPVPRRPSPPAHGWRPLAWGNANDGTGTGAGHKT